MKKLSVACVLIILACSTLPSQADSPTTAPSAAERPASRELLAHLQKQLQTVDSMQADFVETKVLSMMKHKVIIQGKLAMVKPNKVIWIVDKPVKYAIKVDADELTQWDEDNNKVQLIHLGGDPTFKSITEQIQALFLADYKVLEKSYDVSVLSDKPLSLRFAPQAGGMVAKMVKNIEVTFGEDETHVDKMVINETTGNMTTLSYSNLKLNQTIPEKTWEIPPK